MLVQLVLTLSIGGILSAPAEIKSKKWKPANYHVATGNQMVMREDNGGIKFGVDGGDAFRAELRSSDGSVKGVYSWLKPDGSPHTLAYSKDDNGNYQAMPNFAQLGISLPPFPYSLYNQDKKNHHSLIGMEGYEPYGALKLKNKKIFYQNNEVTPKYVVRPYDLPIVNPINPFNLRPYDEENPTIIDVDEDNVSADDVDDDLGVLVGEGNENQPGPGGPFNEILGIQVPQGTPVAQAVPESIATSGTFGQAQATPGAIAEVGAGGIAIAFPTGTAIAGPLGIAISKPSATSQAGFGGISIAGGVATASVVEEEIIPEEGIAIEVEVEKQEEPGFIEARVSTNGDESEEKQPILNFSPIIANYFFSHPSQIASNPDQQDSAQNFQNNHLYPVQQYSHHMNPYLYQPFFQPPRHVQARPQKKYFTAKPQLETQPQYFPYYQNSYPQYQVHSRYSGLTHSGMKEAPLAAEGKAYSAQSAEDFNSQF